MNPPYNRPDRGQTLSPASLNTNNTGSSEWSGMISYEQHNRSDSPYSPSLTYSRGDFVTPPEQGGQYGHLQGPMNGGYDVAPPPIPVSGQPRRPSDTPSRNPSPANSVANSRSSDGTLSDVQSRKYRRMEMEVAQHYTVLRSYLRGGAPQPPRPNKARDKLLRLSPVQFHELSTDVFDELQRRQASAPLPGRPRRDQVPPFLQPRSDFHEKRNQARQKLSSLQTSRFRDLSTDVFCELERRFPHFQEMQQNQNRRRSPRGQGSNVGLPNGPASGGFIPPPRTHSAGMSVSSQGGGQQGSRRGPNGSIGGPAGSIPQFDNPPGSFENDSGRPMPKQFHSNTLIPTKSTMVEDGDEDQPYGSRFDRSSDAFGLESALSNPKSRDTTASSKSSASREAKMIELQEKIEELNTALRLKDEELRAREESSKSTINSDLIETKQDLEQRLEDAENVERDLRSKLDKAQKSASVDSTLRSNHDRLQQQHTSLQQKLEQQRQVTEEVRRQAHAHLMEMREMADSGGGNLEREERLQQDVHRLGEELQEWKARYTKTKTQLRNIKAMSMGVSLPMARPDVSFEAPDGVVRDVNVTKFQLVVEELLHVARVEPSKVLESMKSLVLAVRSITSDVDRALQLEKDDPELKRRLKLKGKVSATANNVITASRNYAAAAGVSPVSLLDAAASHLSVAIVELVRAVKIRPSQADELEDDDAQMIEGTGQEGYFDVGKSLKRHSQNGSIYSAISTPPRERMNGHAESGPGPEVLASYAGNTNGGMGVKAGFGLHEEEEGDFEELKLYLEDQTDSLVASIQSLVASIRQEDVMPLIRSHIGAITDVVGNVISATEGVIEEAPHGSRLATILERAVHQDVQQLEETRRKLLKASVESQSLDSARKGDGKVKMLTQGLPPLAFGMARDMKSLVANIEGVDLHGEEDFS